MISFTEQIADTVSAFTEKEKKNYKIDTAIRLFEKLKLNQKQDWDTDFNELIQLILEKEVTEKQKLKSFRRRYNTLATKVRKKCGYIEKGYLQSNAMALGIGIGVAVGTALLTINTAFLGVGIAIGVAVGLAIGANQEKEAEKKGKLF